MKLKTGILIVGMALGTAWGQNPDIIQDTRSTLQNVQKKQTIDQNAVLAAAGQGTAKSAANPAATIGVAPAKVAVQGTAAKASATKAASGTRKPVVRMAAPKKQAVAVHVSKPPQPKPEVAVEDKKNPPEPKHPEKTYSSAGKRDPFISPVVTRSISGSGCSSGKRCLAIDQIALTGIVKSDTGMIAVVVNAMNKAYFLRENDPVFNGYVVKITGDSIVFKETLQDKLGKPFEREVTKKIFTPAV